MSFKLSFNNKVFNNLFFSGLSQLINLLIPILIYPFLINKVGTEKFGLIVYSQVIINFLSILIDYGFNITAVRDISNNKENIISLRSIYSNVLTTKIILTTIYFILLNVGLFFINNQEQNIKLYYSTYLYVVGQAIFPLWFFQGLEKFKAIFFINLIGRLFYIVLIFFIVKSSNDFIIANFSYGFSSLISGILGVVYVRYKINLIATFPSLKTIKECLITNKDAFFSNLLANLVLNLNGILIGFFSNNIHLAYFAIAEKVYNILRTFPIILHQSTYPKVCNLVWNKSPLLKKYIIIFLVLGGSVMTLSALIVSFSSSLITQYFNGHSEYNIELSLKIIAFAPIFTILNIPFTQILFAKEQYRLYHLSLSFAIILNILLNIIVSRYYGVIGTSVTVLFTESFLAIFLFALVYIKYFKVDLSFR